MFLEVSVHISTIQCEPHDGALIQDMNICGPQSSSISKMESSTQVLSAYTPNSATDPYLLSEEIFQALTTLVNVLAIVHVEK